MRFVHAHAPAAEFLNDAVVRNGAADYSRKSRTNGKCWVAASKQINHQSAVSGSERRRGGFAAIPKQSEPNPKIPA